MATAQELNTQFGINGHLSFRQEPSGLIIAEIDNAQASASLCLQGAHLMTWRPKSQVEPVVWLSRDAKLAPGKSIRGGAPICWPWFGAHATEPGFPGHGYARTVPWQVVGAGIEEDGSTRITMRLVDSDRTHAQWPQDTQLDLTVTVGELLRMELTTTNTGKSDFTIGEALHTYLHIGDIAAVRITGLEGCDYWDKVGGSTLKKQDGAIAFSAETDRVYINTAAECVIEDDKLKRRIYIKKTGSLATVVWTPWLEKANKMGDMGQPDGWREMVCVETANALDNILQVKAGASHSLVAVYRAESM